jgi:hypothetical protein
VFILNKSRVIPEFWVAALDETKHWADGYLAECNIKQEFVVYLVDVNRHTHLASLTPSLWLEYVDHFAVMEDGFDDEKWRDEAIDATSGVGVGVGESGYYDVFDPSKKPRDRACKVQPCEPWLEEYLAGKMCFA